jgi:hypothetical protein
MIMTLTPGLPVSHDKPEMIILAHRKKVVDNNAHELPLRDPT